MMHACIFKPRKSAMQSGRRILSKPWYLQLSHTPYTINPLTGWVSGDASNQVTLQFSTKEQAINYAKENNYTFEIYPNIEKSTQAKSYSDNFAHDRNSPWTH